MFDEDCLQACEELKAKLVSARIVKPPDLLPFEIICDASDNATGAVLGQHINKIFLIVYYASKTLFGTQKNYITLEKELLVIVYALEKFRTYLMGAKVTIHTNHAALKYLIEKNDAKPRLT